MLLALYITFVILAFLLIFLSFIVNKDQLAQQIVLLGISMILFGALAMASANVEVLSCQTASDTCVITSLIFEENMYIFGFFGLFISVLFFIKSLDAFYFTKGRL